MRRGLLVILILLVVVGAVLVLQKNNQKENSLQIKPPLITKIPLATPLLTPPGSPAAEKNITVSSPRANQTVGKSFIVTGQARVFENVVSLRLTNTRDNKVYALAVTDAKAPDVGQFGEFTYTVNLSQTSLADVKPQDKLLLEVFQQSAKDGSEIDKVQIPLIFQ